MFRVTTRVLSTKTRDVHRTSICGARTKPGTQPCSCYSCLRTCHAPGEKHVECKLQRPHAGEALERVEQKVDKYFHPKLQRFLRSAYEGARWYRLRSSSLSSKAAHCTRHAHRAREWSLPCSRFKTRLCVPAGLEPTAEDFRVVETQGASMDVELTVGQVVSEGAVLQLFRHVLPSRVGYTCSTWHSRPAYLRTKRARIRHIHTCTQTSPLPAL